MVLKVKGTGKILQVFKSKKVEGKLKLEEVKTDNKKKNKKEKPQPKDS